MRHDTGLKAFLLSNLESSMLQIYYQISETRNVVLCSNGFESGPLILLDKEGMNTEIITRFQNFMTTHSVYGALGEKQACWGIMGNVSQIPAGYSVSFIKVSYPIESWCFETDFWDFL